MAVVETLGRLSDVSGRADVARLLCGAATESQARFIATSLRMLAEYHRDKKPLTALAVHGPVIGRDRDGALVVPAPVDHVSWIERVASFATNPDFLATRERTLWITGKLSPRARTELAANGWSVRERPIP